MDRLTTVDDCRIIDLRKISDVRGNLTPIEANIDIPFDIKRVYYLYDVPGGESRGAHAHKELYQLIIAASGSFTVTLADGWQKKSFNLNRSYYGLYIPHMTWRAIDNFSTNSVALVLSNIPYDANDYIEDFNEFIKLKNG